MAVAPDSFSDQISSRRPEIPGFARRNFALAILGTIVLLLLIGRAWRLNRGSAYSAPDFAGVAAHTIPPQQSWSPAPDPPPPPALIEMGDRQAAKYIVRDISSAAEGQWRWTFVDPTLQIFLKNYQGQRFLMDFGI